MTFIDYIKDRRIMGMLALLVLLGVADLVYGIHLGIEFAGGTQIPITLQTAVNPSEMSSIITTISQRVSSFGLRNPTVQGIGSSEIEVTLPTFSSREVNQTIALIDQQGYFQGILGGREAVNNSDIIGGSSGISPSYQIIGSNVSWVVSFYISQPAAQRFARVAFGQGNKPLYMYLDRPSNTIVILNKSILTGTNVTSLLVSTLDKKISALQDAVAFSQSPIPIELLSTNGSNWNSVRSFLNSSRSRYSQVIVENGTPSYITSNLIALNYTVKYESIANMTPTFIETNVTNQTIQVQSWPAVGLLSSPIVAAGLANGNISESYEISGPAPSNLTETQAIAYANNESTFIASILSGGALPVHIIIGTPTVTPPTLGKSFEYISAVALILAVLAVAITIVIRYKKLFLILPIIFTTLAELFIIVSIIGVLGSIDLANIAGMIAVIGTGVDAQIIITDEVLTRGKDSSMRVKLNSAFYIVWADAALLSIAMLPLLFSPSLVDVVGFAESTIFGALLGAFVTRPAYGAILSRRYSGAGTDA